MTDLEEWCLIEEIIQLGKTTKCYGNLIFAAFYHQAKTKTKKDYNKSIIVLTTKMIKHIEKEKLIATDQELEDHHLVLKILEFKKKQFNIK